MGGLRGPRGRPVEARGGPPDHVLQRQGHRGLHADRQGGLGHRDGLRGRHAGALGDPLPRVRRVARHRLRPDTLRPRVRARQRPQGLPHQGRAHVVLPLVRLPLLRARHARGPEPLAGRQSRRARVDAHAQLLAQCLLLALGAVVSRLPRLPRGQGRPGAAAGRVQHAARAALGGPWRPRLGRRDDGAPRGLRGAPRRDPGGAAGRRPRGNRRRRRAGHAPRVRGGRPRPLGRDVGPREGRHHRAPGHGRGLGAAGRRGRPRLAPPRRPGRARIGDLRRLGRPLHAGGLRALPSEAGVPRLRNQGQGRGGRAVRGGAHPRGHPRQAADVLALHGRRGRRQGADHVRPQGPGARPQVLPLPARPGL